MNTINKSLKRKERRKNERMKMGINCCLKCRNHGAVEGGKEKKKKEKKKKIEAGLRRRKKKKKEKIITMIKE